MFWLRSIALEGNISCAPALVTITDRRCLKSPTNVRKHDQCVSKPSWPRVSRFRSRHHVDGTYHLWKSCIEPDTLTFSINVVEYKPNIASWQGGALFYPTNVHMAIHSLGSRVPGGWQLKNFITSSTVRLASPCEGAPNEYVTALKLGEEALRKPEGDVTAGLPSSGVWQLLGGRTGKRYDVDKLLWGYSSWTA